MRDGVDRCWNRIGVAGDASCERLAAMGHCRNCDEYAGAGRAMLDRGATEAMQAEWTRQLGEPRSVSGARGESVMVFQVRDEYLALHTTRLERVTSPHPFHSLPGRGGGPLKGVVNVDGELLPCFSLAAVLHPGEDHPPAESGCMLLLDTGAGRLVCAVDRVLGAVRLTPADLEAPPVTLARNARALTSAVFAVRGKRAGLLDPDKLVERLMRSAAV